MIAGEAGGPTGVGPVVGIGARLIDDPSLDPSSKQPQMPERPKQLVHLVRVSLIRRGIMFIWDLDDIPLIQDAVSLVIPVLGVDLDNLYKYNIVILSQDCIAGNLEPLNIATTLTFSKL